MKRYSLRTVCLAAGIATVIPVAAILGIRLGRVDFWTAVLLSVAVLQPVAAAAILVFALPGRRPFLLPLACGLGGLAAAALLGIWQRHSEGSAILAFVSQVFVALPFFAGGLVAWWSCLTLGDPAGRRDSARWCFALSLFAGAILSSVPLEAILRARDVDQAKAFIEVLAGEMRREVKEGTTNGVVGIMEREGIPPLLVEKPFYTSAEEDGVHVGFTRRTFMGLEGWTYRLSSGTWDHWVD